MSGKLIRLLGLGLRAGRVVVGVTGVRAQLQRDGLSCVVLAADASPRTREKVEPVVPGPAALALGAGLGGPAGAGGSVQAVGVADAALARGVMRLGRSE